MVLHSWNTYNVCHFQNVFTICCNKNTVKNRCKWISTCFKHVPMVFPKVYVYMYMLSRLILCYVNLLCIKFSSESLNLWNIFMSINSEIQSQYETCTHLDSPHPPSLHFHNTNILYSYTFAMLIILVDHVFTAISFWLMTDFPFYVITTKSHLHLVNSPMNKVWTVMNL